MGRQRSRLMTEALSVVRKFPKISSRELRRILEKRGIHVAPAYSRKLKQRTEEILSRSENCVTPNSVTVPEAEVKTQKIEEKESKLSSVEEISFTQPQTDGKETVTQLTTGVLVGFDVHGGKFGVVLDAGFYWWVRKLWNVKGQATFQRMRGFVEPWVGGCYYGVSFTVLPPCEGYDGRSLLIWSISRPGSVAAYRESFLRIQGFAGEYGYEFDERDVWLVQRMHYAEAGDRFGFGEPVKVCFADGGFVMFDRSRGFSETEYDSIDTFLKLVEYKISADQVEGLAKHMGALSRRVDTLEKITVTAKMATVAKTVTGDDYVRRMNPGEEPVYKKFQPPWLRQSSERSVEEEYEASREPGYHDCVVGLVRPVPECMVKGCRFGCRLLWRES